MGLELPDNGRAGCAGLILAPDIVNHAVRAWTCLQAGDEAGVEAAYARLLPAASFVMQSVESLVCYGKRVIAVRLGLHVHDRAAALRPTALGLRCVQEHAARLGPFGGG